MALLRIGGLALLIHVMGSTLVFASAWRSFGARPEGARLERIERSPNWNGRRFVNSEPMRTDYLESLSTMASVSPYASPKEPIPVVRGDGSRFEEAPASGLRVTWLGHSTSLVELDGRRLLLDPVWSERSSPYSWIGPKRWYAPPIPLEALPPIDAVLISHDHFDHLSEPTIVAIKGWDTIFVVPLGVGAHLVYWGVPEQRIVELDWWERTEVGGLEVTCTPARHASGRNPLLEGRTLWAGFAMRGATQRIFYSGDTGLFPGLQQIGEKLGPFDLTVIEVGAYNQAWPDWHIGPEQAVRAHEMLQGGVLLPVHWGLWNLASHGWTEPVERVLAAAEKAGVTVTIPRPGQSVELAQLPALERWWPDLPWKTAQDYPIVSTRNP